MYIFHGTMKVLCKYPAESIMYKGQVKCQVNDRLNKLEQNLKIEQTEPEQQALSLCMHREWYPSNILL